jgi:hypothetical protein
MAGRGEERFRGSLIRSARSVGSRNFAIVRLSHIDFTDATHRAGQRRAVPIVVRDRFADVVVKLLRTSGRLAVISLMAMGCAHPAPPAAPSTPPAPPPSKIQLAVIPADSDAFPRAARAVSASLATARVSGVDDTMLSKVSLEVVQLSIECVDPTAACYEAIGRSMAANRLLFARIDGGATRRELKVTVTLFDVDAKAAVHTAQRAFATEDDATAGVAALVAEVTR